MRAYPLPFTAALLLLLAGPVAVMAAQETEKEGTVAVRGHYSRYEVRFLNVHAAETLAWDLCPDKSACIVQGLTSGRGAVLNVRADSETHARIAKALSERDLPRTQSFQVVLLAAGGKANGGTPDLAPGAQKALDDLKQFLPYKTYRTLDTAWVRITQDDVAQARMAGLLDATYELVLRFRSGGTDGKQLLIDGFSLKAPGDLLQTGLKAPGDQTLIQTTFAMSAGETVVVGTSSVSGSQEALVALLTAVP